MYEPVRYKIKKQHVKKLNLIAGNKKGVDRYTLRYDCGVCCVGSYEDRRYILLIMTVTVTVSWMDIGTDVSQGGGEVRERLIEKERPIARYDITLYYIEWQSTDSSKGRGRVLCKGEDSDSDSAIVSILIQLMQTTCS